MEEGEIMDFEKARAIKAAYDAIPVRQHYKRLQDIMIAGAKAREAGEDEDACPYPVGRFTRRERTWWGDGWRIMNRALEDYESKEPKYKAGRKR